MSVHSHVDLFVIGGGSGGVRAARIAAEHGAQVAIAEESRFGGTCVIRGCVPKKLLVYAGRFSEEFEYARSFGWHLNEGPFDWRAFKARSDAEVARLEAAYRSTLSKSGVELIDERAIVADSNTVALVKSGRRFSAKHILIATGGKPAPAIGFPGSEFVLTSDDVFNFDRLPRSLLLLGGGYISVEFASVFGHLGSRVHIAYRSPTLLRGFDLDIAAQLEGHFQKRGIDLSPGTTVKRIEKLDNGEHRVILSNQDVVIVEAVVSAMGRVPNTSGLDLETIGVELDEVGAVRVDDQSRTAVPSVFAVGDVINRTNLTPVAIRAGHALADQLFAGHARQAPGSTATAIFTTPEIGTVGLSEQDARKACVDVKLFRAEFTPMKASFGTKRSRTFMKLVVDGASDKVIGVHIVGPDAGEIIQMAGVALTMGATKSDFDRTVAVHPTAAEELVTMRREFVRPL